MVASDLASLINLATQYAESQEQLIAQARDLERLQLLLSRNAISESAYRKAAAGVQQLQTRLRVTKEMVELAIESTADEVESWQRQFKLATTRYQAGEMDALQLQDIERRSRTSEHRLRMLRRILNGRQPAAKPSKPKRGGR